MWFDERDDAFWDYGPGAFCWSDLHEGGVVHKNVLWLRVPHPTNPKGELILLYPGGCQPNNWAAPGPCNRWDGNLDEPTLSPSILAPGVWHGYLRKGKLVTV